MSPTPKEQINVFVFHNQLNIIMQTPMTFIKFGLTASYWMVGIPMRVSEIPNTFKTKTSFHIAEYLRLVVTALLLSPFCFFQYGKYFSTSLHNHLEIQPDFQFHRRVWLICIRTKI